MDSNHRSTGYEPVGISWLPYPATGLVILLTKKIIIRKRVIWNSSYSGDGFEPSVYGLWARRDLLATLPRYGVLYIRQSAWDSYQNILTIAYILFAWLFNLHEKYGKLIHPLQSFHSFNPIYPALFQISFLTVSIQVFSGKIFESRKPTLYYDQMSVLRGLLWGQMWSLLRKLFRKSGRNRTQGRCKYTWVYPDRHVVCLRQLSQRLKTSSWAPVKTLEDWIVVGTE